MEFVFKLALIGAFISNIIFCATWVVYMWRDMPPKRAKRTQDTERKLRVPDYTQPFDGFGP